MLRKLMKYEMSAMGRILLPIYVVVLFLAVSCNVASRILQDSTVGFFQLMSGFAVMGYVLACVAVCLVSFGLMVKRFYSNLLTDQGYVMMTLPVSIHQQIMSKLLTSCLWFCLTAGVVGVSIIICMIDIEFPELWRFFWGTVWEEALTTMGVQGGIAIVETIIVTFLSFASSCLGIYAALAIGQSFAGSKLLWAVVVYIGSGMVIQTVSTAVFSLAQYINPEIAQWLTTLDASTLFHATMVYSMVSGLVYCCVAYAITAFFMNRKLNLA